ncbi:MAG TPA: cytidylate kinase-like family protein [Lachnospiraceae bacterium]|nr:cytidylate kinase-like family protein [Lachnospiraceae bacterium]
MYKFITMEREFASGGNEIGRRVAKKLGIALYDRNILVEAAKRLEISPVYIGDLEETAPGSIIFNLSKTAMGGSKKDNPNLPMTEKLFLEEKKIIEEIVEKEECVIVGRCASFILKDRTDCLKVFIHADKDYRINRAVETEKIAQAEAKDFLRKSDKRRSSFYNTHTGWKWGDMSKFDLCLNSQSLGIDKCVDILAEMMR